MTGVKRTLKITALRIGQSKNNWLLVTLTGCQVLDTVDWVRYCWSGAGGWGEIRFEREYLLLFCLPTGKLVIQSLSYKEPGWQGERGMKTKRSGNSIIRWVSLQEYDVIKLCQWLVADCRTYYRWIIMYTVTDDWKKKDNRDGIRYRHTLFYSNGCFFCHFSL